MLQVSTYCAENFLGASPNNLMTAQACGVRTKTPWLTTIKGFLEGFACYIVVSRVTERLVIIQP